VRQRHPETHLSHRSKRLRAAVLGANDGILSTSSLVLGVAASGASRLSALARTLAAVVLAIAVSASATAAATATAGPTLPLGHAERWITDADGRVVVLHGLNLVNKLPPYAPDALGFGDDDAAFLASEGYDSVRLGVIYAAVEPQPGVYDDAYLARIARTVAVLARHGITTLLDFHQDLLSERFQGEGFPDWAVQDDGLPAEPKAGFPGNYVGMPALEAAFDHLWRNDDQLADRYAAAWAHVARRFRDTPAVLGYDLFNEPWPGSAWPQCAQRAGCPEFDALLSAFFAKATAAIRAVDPTTLVFREPNVLFSSGAPTLLADSGDASTGLSFHDYCAANELRSCRAPNDQVFANALDHADASGDALLLTEFGATSDAAVLTDMADRADRFGVGWLEWAYCGCGDPTTTGPGDEQALIRDPHRAPTAGDNANARTLGALTRPYPRVVAGTPTRIAYDARTRRFTLRYRTARADGRGAFGPRASTEVVLPRRAYPHGARVRVRGGVVRSAAGARVLRVTASAGAVEVVVSVAPRL
jgi:endoglycosylceramidase